MVKYLKIIKPVLKGLIIGGTMTVPGISGGSMAMIVGIYENLIYCVSHIFKEPKKCITFLLKVSIGGVVGMFLFASFIQKLLSIYPMPTHFFFLGAVFGGIPVIFRACDIKKIDFPIFIYPIIGVFCVYAISLLPAGLFAFKNEFNFVYIILQLLGGFIISIALVLPGISTSQMLLMLGLYEMVLNCLRNFDFLLLTPLIVGILVGTFVTSKILDKLFMKYKRATYLVVFGFLLGSLVELFPKNVMISDIFIDLLSFLVGFVLLYFMSKMEK